MPPFTHGHIVVYLERKINSGVIDGGRRQVVKSCLKTAGFCLLTYISHEK